MAFLAPEKPLRSPSRPYDDDEERPASAQSSVTSCLCLKADGVRRSLDKEVVLHRIRQRKRVNQINAAIQSLLGASPEPGGKSDEAPSACWLGDAFSAP